MAMLRGSVQMGELLVQNGAKIFTGKSMSLSLSLSLFVVAVVFIVVVACLWLMLGVAWSTDKRCLLV
jgi:hypothetical protein